MVSMRRLPGPKNPAEMTYYAQLNGAPISGTTAAKTLSSLDSQTMALTLGYFVQVQAERKLLIILLQYSVTLSYIMNIRDQASHTKEGFIYPSVTMHKSYFNVTKCKCQFFGYDHVDCCSQKASSGAS